MNHFFLNKLFNSLNTESVNYCVLRGYEGLPELVTNDVDFGVAPEDIKFFFNILHQTALFSEYKINVELIRFQVIKLKLTKNKCESIKIDVWWGFNYVGFHYINIKELLISRRLYNNKLYVPSNEYEFALSFLKELLHNNWIRKDKRDSLRSKITSNYYKPFKENFRASLVDACVSAVNNNQLIVRGVAFKAKGSIIIFNIKNKGVAKVLKNVFLFFKYKYFYKNEYDFLIK